MLNFDWAKGLPVAVTVCDRAGVIVYMKEKAAKTFESDGGFALVGKNIFDCHPESASKKIRKIMDGREPNVYTIEKNGVKKLIYQTPWFEAGETMGLAEFSLEIPLEMPHFIRK
jgi:transcriptional regulator with PAS, ATPase and Fis domain